MSEVIVLKRKFTVGIACIMSIVTTLLLAGCSNGSQGTSNLKGISNTQKTSTTSSTGSKPTINQESNTITDSELIDSINEDSSVQIDSIDTGGQLLSDEEMDLQLNNNSNLNNIPSNFNVK